MEKHLDFTIDFETCSLSANAAPMQVAVVPWLRDGDDPFSAPQDVEEMWPDHFLAHVDLRSCIVEDFDFSMETIKWWGRQSAAAKRAVTEGFPEPITDVLVSVLDYIRDIVKQYNLESICLWSQGGDVDIAILRNLCIRYDIDLEETIPHTSFRDCRTVILEAAQILASSPAKLLASPSTAYDFFDPLPAEYANGSVPHDALYDARRSSWYAWQALRLLNTARP